MQCFSVLLKSVIPYIYCGSEEVKNVIEFELTRRQLKNYELVKKILSERGYTAALLFEGGGGSKLVDVPEGWIYIGAYDYESAGGKYQTYMEDEELKGKIDEVMQQDLNRIRNGEFDVIFTNAPLRLNALTIHEKVEIYEAFMKGPARLEHLLGKPVEDVVKQQGELIDFAIKIAKARMDKPQLSDDVKLKELQDSFVEKLKNYWIEQDMKVMAAPYVEDMIDAMTYKQYIEIACYIAYEEAMKCLSIGV